MLPSEPSGTVRIARMDEIVRSAMAKWPNVPAVYGWLALDRRGQWSIKGERIENPAIIAFIGRNYEHDREGNWYFQNGPQRVYVDLEYTPWILRLAEGTHLATHTQSVVRAVSGAWLDECGVLIVLTEIGAGMVDDRDLEALASRITGPDAAELDDDTLVSQLEDLERGGSPALLLRYADRFVRIQPIRSAGVAAHFGFNPHPKPAG